ncbi:hypothetical protein D3C86_1898660 [compost metagenome]
MAWDGRGWSIAMDLSCIYGERREALLGSQAGCGNASNLEPIVKAAAAVFNSSKALLFDKRTDTNYFVHLEVKSA